MKILVLKAEEFNRALDETRQGGVSWSRLRYVEAVYLKRQKELRGGRKGNVLRFSEKFIPGELDYAKSLCMTTGLWTVSRYNTHSLIATPFLYADFVRCCVDCQ